MDLFNVLAILISLTAAFSYINYRFSVWKNPIGKRALGVDPHRPWR
jgi:hypothetical protein